MALGNTMVQLWPVVHDIISGSMMYLRPLNGHRGLCEATRHAFVMPDLWMPNSRALSPTGYKILGIIQQRVYQTKVQDVNDFRQCLIVSD